MKLDFVRFNVLHNETFHFIVNCLIYIIGFFMLVAVVYLAIQILIQKKDYTENIKLLRMYIWDAYITLLLLLATTTNNVFTYIATIITSGLILVLFYRIMFENLVTDKILLYKYSFWLLLMILALIDKGVMVI